MNHTEPLLFDAPAFVVTKSYRDENGQMFIEGIASTIDVDLEQERMSPEAIAIMAARLPGKPLREEHQKGYLNKLGEIIQADVIDDDQGNPALWIKAKLYDWSSAAKDTFNAIKSGVKLGLSVAGSIKPGGLVHELVEAAGTFIPTYKDIDPSEVSVTDHPANLSTFAVAVAKSMNQTRTPEATTDTTPATEKVIQESSQNAKEVSDMKKSKIETVEKFEVSGDVKAFAKEWGQDLDEQAVAKTTEETAPEATEATESTEQTAPDGGVTEEAAKATEEEATTETTKEMGSEDDSHEETAEKSTDAIATVLAQIVDTLAELKGTAAEDETDVEDAAPQAPSLEDCMNSLTQAMDQLKAMATAKSVEPTEEAPVETPEEKSVEVEPVKTEDGATEKALVAIAATLTEMVKSQTALHKSIQDQPRSRKGVAMVVEKQFDNGETHDNTDLYETLKSDKEISFKEQLAYKELGIVPAKYAK